MKRHTTSLRVLALICTVGLFFLADWGGSAALQSFILRSSFRFSRLYSGDLSQVDIVAMGNSRAVNSFYVPEAERVTGRKCINLAYNGLGSHEQLRVLQDLLKHNEPPKLLLVEATCLEDESSVSNLRPFWACSEGLSRDAKLTLTKDYYVSHLSRLFRFNTEMTYRILYFLWKDDRYSINRYVISDALIEREKAAEAAVRLPMPNEANVAPIAELARLANDSGITVRLYVAPYLPSYRRRIENLPEWKEELQRLLGGIPLWDLSDSIDDGCMFADRIHSNVNAAPNIIQTIQSKGMLEIRDGTDEV